MILTILLFVTAALEVNAQTTLRLQGAPKNIRGDYSISQEAVLTETFSVRHRGDGASYFITFSAGQSGNFLSRQAVDGVGNVLGYQIYGDPVARNILKDLSASPSSSEVLAGSFATGSGWQQQDHSFSVVLPRGQFPVAGRYQDTVLMSLYQGTPENPETKIADSSFSLTVTMAKLLDISLVPENYPFNQLSTVLNLNYGILTAGAVRTSDIVVRGNVSHRITVMSQNGGVLRPADLADTSTVPYLFTADGVTVNLSAGVQTTIAAGAGPTTLDGSRYRLSFTVGDFGMATEGDYTDNLTFTVIAN